MGVAEKIQYVSITKMCEVNFYSTFSMTNIDILTDFFCMYSTLV